MRTRVNPWKCCSSRSEPWPGARSSTTRVQEERWLLKTSIIHAYFPGKLICMEIAEDLGSPVTVSFAMCWLEPCPPPAARRVSRVPSGSSCSYYALLAGVGVKAHLRWQPKPRAGVLHPGCVWVVSEGPWSPSAYATAAGPCTDGLAGRVQSLKWTQRDSRGAICHCPKPFSF